MTDFRGAIVRNGEVMSESALDAYTDRIFAKIDEMLAAGLESPTEFEVVTALAFLYFADVSVDFVILEVGLGGAGDSTNVIDDCLIAVITSISLDHCDVLGHTVEAIAKEKAGIIKPGSVVVNGASGAAGAVIKRTASEMRCQLFDASAAVPRNVKVGIEGTEFSVDIGGEVYEHVRLSMIGKFQAENAVCALCVSRALRDVYDIELDEGKLRDGMWGAALPGRFERVDYGELLSRGNLRRSNVASPAVVLDGAHNPDGMRRVAETVASLFAGGRVLTVFAAQGDKNAEAMLGLCADFSETIITTQSEHTGRAAAEELRETLRDIRRVCGQSGARDRAISDPAEAVDAALREGESYDLILITGSLYLIRDLRMENRNHYWRKS
ncbi:MAG: hypothetical protein LBQ21_02115, partial [Clostridiales Family XIII bacterium]|jgi:dihydrofolate synthase/folylpolyglutamate synthase|nr:hypothetical protein [Clostridiales Family XIII bacterium]